MGDLFSSFNPNMVFFGLNLPLNWLSSISVFFFPQMYWITKSKVIKSLSMILHALVGELKVALGMMVSPGTVLFFLTTFFFILFSNLMGLLPYVFTSSSHLSFTLALSLPIWIGYMVMSLFKQFNMNMSHMVPEGTPPPLMPLMVIIESVSLIIRPFTLAIRLSANMIAGHLLLTLLGSQGVSLSATGLSLLFVAILALIALESAVACIQAYVFTILSSLYLNEHNSISLSK